MSDSINKLHHTMIWHVYTMHTLVFKDMVILTFLCVCLANSTENAFLAVKSGARCYTLYDY